MLELSEVINAYDQAIINSRAYGIEPNQLYLSTVFHLKSLRDLLDKNVPKLADDAYCVQHRNRQTEYFEYIGKCPSCHRLIVSNRPHKTCYCGQKLQWKAFNREE